MVLTLIIFLLLGILLYKGTRKPEKYPPGPPRLPLVGSSPYMAIKSKPAEPRSLLSGIRKGTKMFNGREEEM